MNDSPHETIELSTTEEQNSFPWVETLKKKMLIESDSLLWFKSNGKCLAGTIGMINCLRREPGGSRIRYVENF